MQISPVQLDLHPVHSDKNPLSTPELNPLPKSPVHSPLGSPVQSDGEAEDGDDVGDDQGQDSPPVDVTMNLPGSPSEDVKSYGDLVRQMVTRLGISTPQATQAVSDVAFDIIQSQLSPMVSICFTKVMLTAAKAPWSKPPSFPILEKRLDHMYRTQEDSAPFLFNHPAPNSLVASSLSKGRQQYSTPPDNEGKKLDGFGR